jgi:4-hydroxy-tetrahydrodipicolinate synthase
VLVLAGAAEANVRETLAACEFYREFGARAAAIVSPFYYRASQDAVLAYYREIARHAPLDIVLYNIPMFASPIDVETVCRLAEIERVIGLKDSSGDMTAMLRMIRTIRPRRPEFSFLSGWETTLVPMLAMGCDGGVNATSGVLPDYFRKLFDLVQSGQLEPARQMQVAILDFFQAAVLATEFPHGIRAAVAMRGFNIGTSQQPQGDAELAAWPEIEKRIGETLAALGYPPQYPAR